jgi:autotransporter-associated beta strand protein
MFNPSLAELRERSRKSGLHGRRGWVIELLESRTLLTTSTLVYPGGDGRLVYAPNAAGDVVPNFSMVGYETGDLALPDTSGGVTVPVKETVNPGAAGVDMTGTIQAAINAVSGMAIQSNGFRGAVLLAAGNYPISGTLNINASGVVLEGVGDNATTGTRLEATGTATRFLVAADGSGSISLTGSTYTITDSYVPVGATSFHVSSTSGLSVGDAIVVNRPSPENWIQAIGMDQLTDPWTAGSKDINWERTITGISGNTVTIDIPLTNSLDQQYGGGTFRHYTFAGRISQVGVSDMYMYSDSVSAADVNHATGSITFDTLDNSWINNVVSNGFAINQIVIDTQTKAVTVDNVTIENTSTGNSAPPAGLSINGQLTLAENIVMHSVFHAVALTALVAGPNVITNVTADGTLSETGPHQRWSSGGLFDNVDIVGSTLSARNALNEGTGHGWQGANYVFWNSSAEEFDVLSPPTAQNWVIGGTGEQEGNAIYDQFGTTVFPQSLYATQMWDRLHADPTVATAAAGPNPLTGTMATLSVLGASDDGEANLTYTWTTTYKPSGAADPTFSVNGTDAAKNTVATLPVIGTYVFVVTIVDPGGLQTKSTVVVSNSPSLAINGDQDSVNENDVIRLVRSGSVIDIFRNNSVTPILQQTYSTSPLLVVSPMGGTDSITIDYSGGDPIPADGLIVNSAAGSDDTISVVTTTGNDAVMLASGSVGVNGEQFGYVGTQELDLALGFGQDTIAAGGDASVLFSRLVLNVSGGGSLTMAASSTLPDFTDLNLTGATFNLGGQSQTIDSLNGNGTVTDTGSAATFTVGEQNGSGVFSGSLGNGTGVLSLTKAGAGTLTLSGTNSYTGSTTISGGEIASGNSASLVGLTGQIIFNEGTLLVTGNSTAAATKNKFTTSFTGATPSGTATLDIVPGVTLTVGVAGGSASLQTNDGGNTHGGDFTVDGGGTLKILSNNAQQDNAFHLGAGTIDLESATGLGGGDGGVVLDASSGTTLILKQDAATNFLTPIDMVDAGGTMNVVIDRQTAGVGVTHSLNGMTSAGAFTLNVTAGPNITSGVAGFTVGSITLSGDGSFNFGGGVLTTVGGVVSGAFAVDLSGLGTLDLQGVNTYSGATNVNGGMMIVDTAGSLVSTSVAVAAGGTLSVKGSLSGATTLTSNGSTMFAAGPSSRTLAGITIGSTGSIAVANSATHGSRTVMVVGLLIFSAGTGKLDLAGNDMMIHNGNLAQITGEIGRGYNLAHWNGAGGISSSAAAVSTNTGLGVELNSANGSQLFATFDGQTATATDVLVKYTYYGDADLSGTVNSIDYGLIDNGLNMSLAGWRNGDFNYDGRINGDDYTLIDNAFNTQGAVSLAVVAAVPEAQVSRPAVALVSVNGFDNTTADDIAEWKKRHRVIAGISLSS